MILFYFYYYYYRKRSLSQVCLHIEAVKKRNLKKPGVLPEYNCLVLSPANFWEGSIESFNQDTNLIGTVFSYQVKDPTSYLALRNV